MAQFLPSFLPQCCSFVNCKKLKVAVVRPEVSLLGIWQEAYRGSCPILPFLPDWLQPMCQLINCQLQCPTQPLAHALLEHFKVVQNSPKKPHSAKASTGWVTHEHPLPTQHLKSPGEGIRLKTSLSGKGEEQYKRSSLSRTIICPISWKLHKICCWVWGMLVGFFSVGTGFLLPAPQTDLFHIIK